MSSLFVLFLLLNTFNTFPYEFPLESIQWKQENYPMQLENYTKRLEISDKLIKNYRSTISGIEFSGQFTNYTVLQREPELASVYGTCDTSNTLINLYINGTTSENKSYNIIYFLAKRNICHVLPLG